MFIKIKLGNDIPTIYNYIKSLLEMISPIAEEYPSIPKTIIK